MHWSESIIQKFRFFWLLGISLVLLGIVSWVEIPKEEDPRLKPRFGLIKLIYPGASVEQMKRLVVQEVEKELASVDSIDTVSTVIRSDFAAVQVDLKDTLQQDSEITRAWDEVEEAVEKAKGKFPQGVFPPEVDRKLSDQEAILIAIDTDNQVRHHILLELEDKLLENQTVSKIKRVGDEGKQIRISIDEEKVTRIGLNLKDIIGQVQAANAQISSGYIETEGNKLNITSTNSFKSLDEIKTFPVASPNGRSIPLLSFAVIQEEDTEPQKEEMRWNGKSVVGLGVIARKNIDLRKFGSEIQETVDLFNKNLKDKNVTGKISIINSQPLYVSNRLNDLAFSLLESMIILGGFLILMMGLRVGLVVSIMLPVISLITLAIYALMGGILHQIAIAAFVMALGLLIDNVIVIVESVKEKQEKGFDSFAAGSETIREFAAPLLSSTLTTIASFLPMYLSKGSSSEFTEAIPKITMIALTVSYFASLFLSPTLSLAMLRNAKENKLLFLEKFGRWISHIIIDRPYAILIGLALFISFSIICMAFMRFKFFPSADRNQVIAQISFPEGTAISKTKEAVLNFEKSILGNEEVSVVTSFIGRSTPFFYYNLNQQPNAPHLAQILIQSKSEVVSEKLKTFLKEKGNTLGGRFSIRSFEQGPPVEAHIVIRIYGDNNNLSILEAERIIRLLEKNKNITEVWHNSKGEQKEALFTSDDRLLIERGLTRQDLSLALLKTTSGIPIGYFKADRESIPLVLSSGNLEKSTVKNLKSSLVGQTTDSPVLTSFVSRLEYKDAPAVAYLRNRKQYVAVLGNIKYGVNPDMVVSSINQELKAQPLPAGYEYEIDGEAKESEKSNKALLAALPLGMIILIATLIWEFNSIRLTLIILTSAPTAFLGIVPGLSLSGKPFGFLALLALFALIGIAVNNGIILIDKFKASDSENLTPEESIKSGIAMRLRPILLTTGSTILGMVPLTMSSSTLWPPFAWSMISGLTVSTLFTLFIVPWLYLKYARSKNKKSKLIVTSFVVLSLFAGSIHADSKLNTAEEMSLEKAIELAANSANAKSAYHEAAAAKFGAKTATYATYMPKFGLGGERVFRDRSLTLSSPLGSLDFANRSFYLAGMELYQTLWSAENMDYKVPAARIMSEAAAKKSTWERRSAQHTAAMAYIDCAQILIQKDSLEDRKKVLVQLSKELASLSYNGKVKETEVLKISFSLGDVERAVTDLDLIQTACFRQLGRLVGREEIKPELNSSLWKFPAKETGDREDLDAFKMKIEANRKEAEGILAENYPELYAKAGLNYNDQGSITPFAYSQLAVGVKWRILDGGTIITRHKQKLQEILSLEEKFKDAKSGVEVGVAEAKGKLESAKKNIIQLKRELLEAERPIASEKARFISGRTASSSYLQVKEMWLAKQELLKMKEIEKIRWEITLSFLEGKLGGV